MANLDLIAAPDTTDVLDDLTAKCAQLQALMLMTHGEAGASFNSLADTHRENFLWHCTLVVDEISELASSLSPATVQVQA
ncbi:hypothetical protein [Limnohabitans sp. WS1]|uniref:hypothetical protein n=1 Tax=Limnohabitans sp. WS1 TaxID=1100726 RepID=UPI0011B28AAD|nr:hypothetical protein [Limnohabitans sp. WS1]